MECLEQEGIKGPIPVKGLPTIPFSDIMRKIKLGKNYP